MSSTFPADKKILILDKLEKILSSRQFANAPAVRVFLEYVVKETLAGRHDRIKAYTIATEVFGKDAEFDPSSDTIVRTTAGRIRRALESYNLECEQDRRAVITLSKGSYVPGFEFREAPSSPEPELIAHQPAPARLLSRRTGILIGVCILAVLAFGFLANFRSPGEPEPLPTNVVVSVRPVQYHNQAEQSLARALDLRLAPALSGIGVVDIYLSDKVPDGTSAAMKSAGNAIAFILKGEIVNTPDLELRWQLIDAGSGQLLWAAKEPLADAGATTLDGAVGRVAFKVLGEGGAVPLTLARYHGGVFSNQTCLSRAQLKQAVENARVYQNMRECLERVVARNPNDPSGWAILSTFYTVRTRYYTADNREERARLIELAGRAAAQAEELAPKAYLTKVALMQLALRKQNIAEFDTLQKQIRASYPGDISLKLRIASRIARLGRGREALKIYDEAQKDWGLNLYSHAADVALAYFVEGDYERAGHQIMRTASDQRYVLILKAAILGKLGRVGEAQPVISQILANDPNIKTTYYPWLSELSWADPLLIDIADGLAKAGLKVEVGGAGDIAIADVPLR